MKASIIYHKADHDGELSAFIARNYYERKNMEIQYIPADYDGKENSLRNLLDHLGLDEKDVLDSHVVMVDFSMDRKAMETLSEKAASFIWIDHHTSAINALTGLQISGKRGTDKAACELTWEFFFPDMPKPVAVSMLSLFDSWKHEDNPSILNLEYALQALDTRPMTDTWASILEMSEKELMDNYDKCGEFIRGREEKINLRNAVHSHSTKYGKYSVAVLNSSGKGSGVFAGKLSSHDIGVSYSIRGNSCSCGVYSLNPDIDVSVIAKAFGGGGHKGASGFNLPVPVFFRLFGLNGSHDKQ